MSKLNLGCGKTKIDGYENLDIKDGKPVYPLDYIENDSCEEIRASHILEHFGAAEVFKVVSDWVSKLKIGGVLKIAVPNFEKVASDYVSKKETNPSGYLMGGQVDEYDFHKSLFDKESLTQLMGAAGLKDIQEWTSEARDCASLPVSLNLMGTKTDKQRIVNRRVSAVMSMPRLTFADTMNCVMTELLVRGIPVHKGTGVFWSQVLTRMIEEQVEKGVDYIITVDYDSWFKYSHVQRLLSLMENYPEADCVFPMQMKRDGDCPLMGLADENGEFLKQISIEDFQKDILPIRTGHFGLTIFRASAFEKLKKPWFVGVPGPDGGWGKGRLDDDIYFWNNWTDCGLKGFIAPTVNIGHLQMLCTFPGVPEDNFKCVHTHLGDLIGEVNQIPEHCL